MKYYEILGVSKTATVDEIKTAYRKLAREHHPDKGGDKETFQNIQEAYENLIDPQKRQNYDNGGNNIPHDFFANFGFPHENQNHTIRKNDHLYNCVITLRDVFFGIVKKIRVNKTNYCKSCNNFCKSCNGNGKIVQKIHMGIFTQIIQHQCHECNGSGKTNSVVNCNTCNNKRTINEEKIFEINIPRGVQSGETYVFDGWGEQANNPNEIPGNLVVRVNIEKHPEFIREGDDLILNCQLSFRESILGKLLTINNFDNNQEINTAGFGLINPSKEYMLINKGMMSKNGTRGNLRLRFKINYPEKSFSQVEIHDLKNVFDKIGLN